jgi:hypothetical protein
MIFFVKRFNNLVSDKYWRNTVHILKNLAYSLTGRIQMWMMVDGKIIRQEHIKPSNDKSIVGFNKANDIVNSNGDLEKPKPFWIMSSEIFRTRHGTRFIWSYSRRQGDLVGN